jgi:hypothetical protein
MSRLEKKLLPLDSQLKARLDLALIDFRRLWEVMREQDKQFLRERIQQIVPLVRSPSGQCLQVRLNVELKYEMGPEEFHIVDVPPEAVKNAIECWDRNEHYAPQTFGELGLG